MTAGVLAISCHLATAGEITGTITLKGTPPKEKDITPLKDDPTCGKLHTEMPTTHFYVVGPKGELADVVVSLQGASGKSAPWAWNRGDATAKSAIVTSLPAR